MKILFVLLFITGAALGHDEPVKADPSRSRKELPDYTNVDPKEVFKCWPLFEFWYPGKPETQAGGFTVSGKNSTEILRSVPAFNGIPVPVIEVAMTGAVGVTDERHAKAVKAIAAITSPDEKEKVRKFINEFDRSKAGFLGPKEDLLDLLAKDNALVVDKCHMTHQALIEQVLKLAAASCIEERKEREKREKTKDESKNPFEVVNTEFLYRGQRFQSGSTFASASGQHSPFQGREDGYGYGPLFFDNLDKGKRIEINNLTAALAYRYGFYQGKGTPFRVPPARTLSGLGFLDLSDDCRKAIEAELEADAKARARKS